MKVRLEKELKFSERKCFLIFKVIISIFIMFYMLLLFVNLGQEWGWVEIHTANRNHILLFQLLGKQAVSCDHEWDLSSESCP